jgi:NAD(P)-dependent dehydrogenase (short-subunit alcohol dehydrogenase family)
MGKVLVTGSNRGIGLELCCQLHDRGDEVIGVCRTASPELSALGIRVIDGIDVSDGDNVQALVQALDGETIDVLINNAGILRSDRLDTIDYDGMLEQYRVNTLGPLRVTQALLPNLHEGSKVAIVSSRVGSIEDNSSGNNYGYRASKTAVNMVGTNLRHDLEPKGIAVILLHPGYVRTDMTGGGGNVSPVDSAKGLIERIDELSMESTGSFQHAEGYALPW